MQAHTPIELKLGTHKGSLKRIYILIFPMKINFMELWSIFPVKMVKGLSCLQGKPLEGIG